MPEKILAALKKVFDPELRINVVDLGLVYRLIERGGTVFVALTMTTPFCPYLPQLVKEVQETVERVSGVKKAEIKLVWTPPWSPQRMSKEAKAQLGIA